MRTYVCHNDETNLVVFAVDYNDCFKKLKEFDKKFVMEKGKIYYEWETFGLQSVYIEDKTGESVLMFHSG